MSSHNTTAPSSKGRRAPNKGRTFVLSALVIILAALTLFGPRLFAQSVTSPVASAAGSAVAAPLAEGEAKHGEAVLLPFGDAATVPLLVVLASAILALAFGFYWWRNWI